MQKFNYFRIKKNTKFFLLFTLKIVYIKNLIFHIIKVILIKGGFKVVITKSIKLLIQEGMPKLIKKIINSSKLISKEKFDSEWYLTHYSDVAEAGLDPYWHYSQYGFTEGRYAKALGESIFRIDSPSAEQLQQLLKLQNKWARNPKISILMPVYNTKEEWLRKAIDSTILQIYENWELCICDDASTLPHIKAVLKHYERIDPRIRVIYSKANSGVAAASNRALKICVGDYVALLDHDDILEPHALHFMAKAIIEKRPDIIYSDEVLMSEDGVTKIGHACRPSFSLDYLRSHPYIVHIVAYRRELLMKINGFNESLSISQDYDLLLRASEVSTKIVHIAEVLYKWRIHEDSSGHNKKNLVMQVSKNIIKQHLIRSGFKDFQVDNGDLFNFFRVRYKLNPENKVAIIIPTKNMGKLVRQCIESIENTTPSSLYDIFVIDHSSTDPASVEYFTKLRQKHTVLRYEGAFNFSHMNNWAVAQLKKKYSHYLLLNNDVEAINSGWLERMLEFGQQSDIGVVGAKLYYPDRKTIQHAGVCVGMFGIAEHFGKFMNKYFINTSDLQPGYMGSLIVSREVSSVTAACMLIKSNIYNQLGGLDEYAQIGFGDVDLCLRVLNSGKRIIFCAEAELIHHESFTRGKSESDPHLEDSCYFIQRWSAFIEIGDPYYSPNLSLVNTNWGLKLKFNSVNENHLIIRETLLNS